ncbi:flagellar basal body P-ring formation chaperone FlgA [Arsenophonus nasoniae]|uniref:Flagella basal body P-ring formation protein FlgA n=1 Tax=Arsenophonus nasoniae TaxID=638 RepID=D2TYH2_9GAMM|nr:flagellar basal body P-ring formation chaperone FlgA [Arsenophonus nasoniae]WGM02719.1 flagellar basal body P-ring formation chaperone FlgA [Arsenophonus nasoniae]CBA72463.1 flagellar basal body P-ring biosynthesis protein FlgA [Arsenophonus nasoniae]
MKRKFVVNRIIVSLLLFVPVITNASATLQTALQDYFNQQYLKQDKVNIKILTPSEHLSVCNQLQIKPAPSQQHWGKLTLPLICDDKTYYLRLAVSVEGNYWVANQPIKRHSVINQHNVVAKRGLLEKLPRGIIRDIHAYINSVSLRDIAAGQPISQNMLRRAWVIQAGKHVTVYAQGRHFQVKYEGKAINNAAENESVRLKMPTGQIITAIAQKEGYAKITLKN